MFSSIYSSSELALIAQLTVLIAQLNVLIYVMSKQSSEMSHTQLCLEEPRQSVSEAKGEGSRAALGLMLCLGMVISGMIESSTYPAPTSASTDLFPAISLSARLDNESTSRRYCDPPNVTVMRLYEMYYDSEEESSERDYDFAQMEELDFKVTLSPEESDAQWRWQAHLWGSLLAPIPAAWLADKVGPGRVFGICLLSAGVLGLLVPPGGLAVQAILVCIQGVVHGCLLPCALLLTISCTPEEKRATFMALLSGGKLGFGLGELIPGHLRPFTTCITGVTWFATWVLMLDTPRLPPKKHPVPWRKLMVSRVVWMSAIAVFGTELLQSTTSYTLRQYLHLVYYFTNRYILALPTAFTFAFALLCANVENFIENTELVSKTTTRRIFVYISHFIPAGALFVSGFVGCDQIAPIALFGLSTAIGGASYAGAFSSILDVAPTYSVTAVALVCTCGAVGRLLPVLQTMLVLDGLMPGSWRLVMSMNALAALVTAMFFMLRGSSQPPSWNYPDMPHPPKPPLKLTFEGVLLRVLAVPENQVFTRARACSTSVAGPRGRIHALKRASIS